MKRKTVRAAAILVVILVASAAAVVFVGGQPARQVRALLGGVDAVAYAQPRSEVTLRPEPSQPRVTPGEAGLDPAALALAVEYAAARNTRALVVGRGGHIVFERYWGDTTFESAVEVSGFTPVLSALLVGVALNDRAIVNLDAPVSDYIAEWKADPRGAVSLRQLLAADSGLASASGWPWPRTLAARYHVAANLRATLLDWPLDAAQRPGEAPADVDADVLSLVLTRVLKQSYDGLLAERVWKPLGGGPFSVGIDAQPGATAHVRAGCCLRARIADWMRVGELLANDGVFEGNQFTPPGYVALMLKPVRTESPLGFFTRVDGAFAAHDVARLEARGKQRLWIVPSLKLVILRVGEEPPANQGWDEAMIPDSIIRGTSGWQSASPDQGIDPSTFAPH